MPHKLCSSFHPWSPGVKIRCLICIKVLFNDIILAVCGNTILNSFRPRDAYTRQWTNQHWFRQWLVAWPAPSHYLNQCWNILIWIHRNKLQWNINRNSNIFIQDIAFENVVWKMSTILSRPQCVKDVLFSPYFPKDIEDTLAKDIKEHV